MAAVLTATPAGVGTGRREFKLINADEISGRGEFRESATSEADFDETTRNMQTHDNAKLTAISGSKSGLDNGRC
jgi:hypothetical protein